MDTNWKGDVAQTAVMAALIKREWIVGLVYGVGKPYDLMVDNGSEIWKVECKHGRLRNGVILFNTATQTRSGGRKFNAVDAFAVYCSDNDKTYLIPIKDMLACRGTAQLRIERTKNNQQKGVLWAHDYEI